MTDSWLITGGGRSGKSSFAEKLAMEKSERGRSGVLYIATGVATDDEMAERIARHQAKRPANWITWERYRGLADIENSFNNDEFGAILLDCMAGLLMGILFEEAPDADNCTSGQFERVESLSISELDALFSYSKAHGKNLILVTNEVGMGIIPGTRYSRYYRDALGRINMHAVRNAENVVMMVAGIPLTLK